LFSAARWRIFSAMCGTRRKLGSDSVEECVPGLVPGVVAPGNGCPFALAPTGIVSTILQG
jgi:hypothetical protein